MTGNADHLEEWRNDPWGPAILKCDRLLTYIIPGYKITQIKEKFEGLRYYIETPFNLMYDSPRGQIVRAIIDSAEKEVEQLSYEKNMQKFKARIAEDTIKTLKDTFKDSKDVHDIIEARGKKIVKGYLSD